jgi:membrane associated rhomboid family serine protease
MDRILNKELFRSAFIPAIVVAALFGIKLAEVLFDISLARFGVLPRNLMGLSGILTYPLIHGDWKHLLNNSVAIFVLGTMVYHFYREFAGRALLWMLLLSGLWLWIGGRPNYHIGASGMVYALFGFLFLSGILRRHVKLMALSLLVVFLYGSLVWGIFPMEEHISWEGHLFGLMAGLGVALAYRGRGAQRASYSWDVHGDEEMPEWYRLEQEQLSAKQEMPTQITYDFIPKDDKNEKPSD